MIDVSGVSGVFEFGSFCRGRFGWRRRCFADGGRATSVPGRFGSREPIPHGNTRIGMRRSGARSRCVRDRAVERGKAVVRLVVIRAPASRPWVRRLGWYGCAACLARHFAIIPWPDERSGLGWWSTPSTSVCFTRGRRCLGVFFYMSDLETKRYAGSGMCDVHSRRMPPGTAAWCVPRACGRRAAASSGGVHYGDRSAC